MEEVGKAKSRIGLPKLDMTQADRERAEHLKPTATVADTTSAPLYPVMAPPHFDLENPAPRFLLERRTKIFNRFEFSWDRVTMFFSMFVALLVSCIIPSVPTLERIWTTEYSPFFPVFTIFLLRPDLRGSLRMGEYMVLGACVGAAFSYAIVQFTHNKWAVWGLWTGFTLLVLLIHSLGSVDFVRLTWAKIAIVTAALAVLFNTEEMCDACDFNKRLLRVLSVFLVPPAIFHVCNALFAPNGAEWHLPYHFATFLESSLEHITLMHRRLQHDHYLILTRHAADESEYEALMSVQATLQTEAAQMTQLASETAARLQHIKQLLATGSMGEFSKAELMGFYADLAKTVTKLHHSLLAMRLAELNEFPGKLDPRFVVRWYEVWTPFLDLLLKRIERLIEVVKQPRCAPAMNSSELAKRREQFMQQYYELVRAYLRNHGGRFPAEAARVSLLVQGLDSVAQAIQKLEDIAWTEHGRKRSSLIEHRLRIFGSVIAMPFRDTFALLKAVVLFFMLSMVTVWRWVTCTSTVGPMALLPRGSSAVVAYAKSNKWRYPVRLTFALSSAGALLVYLKTKAPFDVHGTWVLVTITLVMLETVGGTISRCLNRLFGTIAAGVIGYVTVSIALWVDNAVWRGVWLFAIAVPLVFTCLYLWTHSRGPYTWQVTLLTFFLIGFSTEATNEHRALRFAVERVLAITVGTLWTSLCTALIWPQYSAKQLHDNCYASVRAFHKAFDRMLLLTVGWSWREEKRNSLDGDRSSALRSRLPSIAPRPLPSTGDIPRTSYRIPIPESDAPPAEAFKEILRTLETTVAQQVALANDTRLERWSPPKRDLPALLLPFFLRTLRILECAGLLLRTPLPPDLYAHLQPLSQVALMLHISVKESQLHMEAALDERDAGDLREFVPPASRSKQFDEVSAALTRKLGAAFHEQFLSDFLRLSALLVLQKELLREWDYVVISVLLENRRTVIVSTAEGTARTVEKESVGIVARSLPLLQRAATKVADSFGGLTPRGERSNADAHSHAHSSTQHTPRGTASGTGSAIHHNRHHHYSSTGQAAAVAVPPSPRRSLSKSLDGSTV